MYFPAESEIKVLGGPLSPWCPREDSFWLLPASFWLASLSCGFVTPLSTSLFCIWVFVSLRKIIIGFRDPSAEKAMSPHSSTLSWKIPWMEEPGRLQSMGSQRVGHDWVTSLSLSLSCLGEGNGNPLQCSCLKNPREGEAWWAAIYGSHRVGHDWSDLAAAADNPGSSLHLKSLKYKVEIYTLVFYKLSLYSQVAIFWRPPFNLLP